MKNFKKQFAIAIILLTINYVSAQDYLMTLNATAINFIDKDAKEFEGEPLISNQTFTYNHDNDEVEVMFNGNEHYEFHNNKKYFIKSNLFWVSEDIVYVTIEEFTIPNFPFKKGTKMKIEITKVDNKYVYYKSTLGGRTWLGKMKESSLE
ncbi:hypothetical protein [Polaribacter sp. Hel1_85]|uniref:hypothetical protein n=1 Tax=Polaribacter sp. Hel1_85 TaxID=1250005 RepID=UPI00052D8812|nr:hypothetical protein [Polaribacter sp. Hel1_85]KGL64166.1 hypothetical protein PHEL85_1218 [Polaribacter sp. Hel1_85]